MKQTPTWLLSQIQRHAELVTADALPYQPYVCASITPPRPQRVADPPGLFHLDDFGAELAECCCHQGTCRQRGCVDDPQPPRQRQRLHPPFHHTAGSATMLKKAAPESGIRFWLNTFTA